MGEICSRLMTKIKAMTGSALVEVPANKMCRITEFVDNGYWRDILTWRLTRKIEE
jgi:hypothetical protein